MSQSISQQESQKQIDAAPQYGGASERLPTSWRGHDAPYKSGRHGSSEQEAFDIRLGGLKANQHIGVLGKFSTVCTSGTVGRKHQRSLSSYDVGTVEGIRARPQRAALVDRMSAHSAATRRLVQLTPGRLTGPVQVLRQIVEQWALSAAEVGQLLAYPNAMAAEDLVSGRATLRGVDRKDRVRLLYQIYRILVSAMGEPEKQQEWLRTPNPDLNNQSPINIMLERRIEGIILVRNLVERLVGR